MFKWFLLLLFRMDNNTYAQVVNDLGIVLVSVGATAIFNGDTTNGLVGIVGGFAMVRIAFFIKNIKD